jgi:hypothetical protein
MTMTVQQAKYLNAYLTDRASYNEKIILAAADSYPRLSEERLTIKHLVSGWPLPLPARLAIQGYANKALA